MDGWKVYVLMGNKVVMDVYVNLEDAFEGAVENSARITPYPLLAADFRQSLYKGEVWSAHTKGTEIQPSISYYVFEKEIKS